MDQWRLSRGGKTFGPFSTAQVRSLLAQNKCKPDDLIQSVGSTEWVPLKSVESKFQPPGAFKPGAPPARPAPEKPGMARAAAAPKAAAPAAPPAPSLILQKLRTVRKPILFGTFGAIGGLLGALLLGELLWYLLAPGAPQVEATPPLRMAMANSLEVYVGGKNQCQVKIARHGFDGPVELRLRSDQPGLEMAPVTLPADKNEAMIEVAVRPDLAPGNYDIDIVAKGPAGSSAGNETPIARNNLSVSVAPAPPAVSLSVPPEIEVYRKGKSRIQVRIARSNFAGPVKVSFPSPPKGISAASVEIPAGKDEAPALLQADADMPLDTVTVTALAEAKLDDGKTLEHEQTFDVKILEAPPVTVDVLFVLDLTGSMQFAINGIRKGIVSFAEQLGAKKIDARIGLLGFRDIEADLRTKDAFVIFMDGKIVKVDHTEFQKLLDESSPDIFTRDYEGFAKLMKELRASGGGDEPESSPLALVNAAKQKYRGNASRVVVFITDATPKLVHFKKKTETIPDAVKALQDANIDQFHIVAHKKHLAAYYQPLLDAFPKDQTSFNDLQAASKSDDAFAALLPKLSEEISKITSTKAPSANPVQTPPPAASARDLPRPPAPPELSVKAVQSTQGFTREQIPRLILAVGIWTAVVAAGICLLLIMGQHFYMAQTWLNGPDLLKGCGGLLAGLIGGLIVQSLFVLTPGGTMWDIVCRTVGWGLLGAMIGGGMALVVPNLSWFGGLEGGLAGGIFGAIGFMLASLLLGGLGGRLLGAAILGFLIGVMIALAEMVFRRFWLELAFSASEIRTVTLGTAPLTVGNDEHRASIFVRGAAAALALCYRLDGDRVVCEDMTTGQSRETPPGDKNTIGNVTITVCSPASARGLGMVLRLSTGKTLQLGDGMPLTDDDLAGLSPQGTDGAVALVSRRPSDPKAMLLRNRSKQTWTVTDPDGKTRQVEAGRSLELAPGLKIDFGKLQGTLTQTDK